MVISDYVERKSPRLRSRGTHGGIFSKWALQQVGLLASGFYEPPKEGLNVSISAFRSLADALSTSLIIRGSIFGPPLEPRLPDASEDLGSTAGCR